VIQHYRYAGAFSDGTLEDGWFSRASRWGRWGRDLHNRWWRIFEVAAPGKRQRNAGDRPCSFGNCGSAVLSSEREGRAGSPRLVVTARRLVIASSNYLGHRE